MTTVSASTVADAKTKATDGTPVTLTGYVLQEVGPGQYKFQDVTGTITVEISREDLPPTEFNEKTKLKIRGRRRQERHPHPGERRHRGDHGLIGRIRAERKTAARSRQQVPWPPHPRATRRTRPAGGGAGEQPSVGVFSVMRSGPPGPACPSVPG
ncbi:NirD/YgiW/YdeI family stress tolerance protein [Streptomyces sp. NPDC054949]